MKFIVLKCPECRANLEIEEGRKQVYCTYCGAKILLENENEKIHRYVDDAKVTHAETERIVKLRQMELDEEKRKEEKNVLMLKIKASIILAIVGTIMIVVGDLLGDLSGNKDSGFYMLSLIGLFPIMAIILIWLMSFNKDK